MNVCNVVCDLTCDCECRGGKRDRGANQSESINARRDNPSEEKSPV